jgi:hypothetical protein
VSIIPNVENKPIMLSVIMLSVVAAKSYTCKLQ